MNNHHTPAFSPQLVERLPLIEGLTDWATAPAGVEDAWNADFGVAETWDVTTRDAEVPGPHGPVPVRVYTPAAPAEDPRPGLVWVHGGAFMWGDLDMPEADAVSRGVAGRANAVVVSVDYRLADEPTPDGGVIPATRNPGGMTGVHAPIPHEDVLASFDWVRDQAEQLGIDPARVAIGGASAGGNLAASVSLHLADAGRAPAASLLLYPALHGHLPEADADELAAAAVTPPLLRWDVPQTMWMAENYLGRPLAEAEPYDFPGLATAPQLAALPPTYIEVDEFDDLRPSGRLYAETLHEAGVDVTYVVRHGVTHGHLNRVGLAEAAQSMDRMAQIVREL